MRHITIGAHRDTHDAEAVAFWIFGGIIMVIAFGEALAVLAATVALVAATSWIYRTIESRLGRNRVELAPVTALRPESIGQRDPKTTSADPTRRGPRAA
ncbi:hypothetical protein [Mycobacterium interjectum]|uniref:hypothetical protein n=1 Tax=Mycobacterium interjectum TaxID=33895 RepID=UPI00082EF0A9|nr:hypothetical protein [Mycobacterium interjectum]MCV7089756.1 hypothetical protein [Mycobacterium interjectum]